MIFECHMAEIRDYNVAVGVANIFRQYNFGRRYIQSYAPAVLRHLRNDNMPKREIEQAIICSTGSFL